MLKFTVLLAKLTWLALGQPYEPSAGRKPPPLHEAALLSFDTDHDGGISLDEVMTTLDSFEKMGASGKGGSPNAASVEESPMANMVRAAKRFAPALHQVMDADGSGKLSKEELEWLTMTSQTLKTRGVLKQLTEGIFAKIDADADDLLSEAELHAAIEGEALDDILSMIQEQLPIPSLSATGHTREMLQKRFQEGLAYLDTNGDGAIERKEMFGAVKEFKILFLQGVSTIETMGPMLAMFTAFQPPPELTSRKGPQATRKRGPPGPSDTPRQRRTASRG